MTQIPNREVAAPGGGPMKTLAIVLGLMMLANGVVMLESPPWWYSAVPGVVQTGPFNQHFIRDIGFIYGMVGGGFIVGALRSNLRLSAWGGATLFLSLHACFHFWEVAVGICAPSALGRDFPGVTMPALIGIVLTLWARKQPLLDRAPARLEPTLE